MQYSGPKNIARVLLVHCAHISMLRSSHVCILRSHFYIALPFLYCAHICIARVSSCECIALFDSLVYCVLICACTHDCARELSSSFACKLHSSAELSGCTIKWT